MALGRRTPLSPMQNDFESVTMPGHPEEDVSLLDILDHVLNAGVVVHGSLVISVAGVDLVYVGLNVILTSVETALRNLGGGQAGPQAGVPQAGLPQNKGIAESKRSLR
ncbi:MAG TPA: gas vesicle protein [Candidatus Angelobacter sp.]|nr:gas vesicle protein [Candidatus Angelobacter sp.]